MDSMFMNCANITSLDLSLFDTSLVFDMSSMFEGCSSLKVLDISNFNMTKVAAPEGEYGFLFINATNLNYINMYCVIKGDFDFSDTELETINSLKVCQKKNKAEQVYEGKEIDCTPFNMENSKCYSPESEEENEIESEKEKGEEAQIKPEEEKEFEENKEDEDKKKEEEKTSENEKEKEEKSKEIEHKEESKEEK